MTYLRCFGFIFHWLWQNSIKNYLLCKTYQDHCVDRCSCLIQQYVWIHNSERFQQITHLTDCHSCSQYNCLAYACVHSSTFLAQFFLLLLKPLSFRNNLDDFTTYFLDGIGINPAQTAGEYLSEIRGGVVRLYVSIDTEYLIHSN